MSSRFARRGVYLSTPPVCRKGPHDPPTELPPIAERVLTVAANWYQPHSPVEGNILGLSSMPPQPIPNTWLGFIVGDLYDLEVQVEFNPATHLWQVVMIVMAGPTPIDQRTWPWGPFRSINPIDSGMLTFPPPISGTRINARILQ